MAKISLVLNSNNAVFIVLFEQNWISYFTKMFIWSPTYQKSVFKRYRSDEYFSEFFLHTRWRQKSAGIDMEQITVIITVCIWPRVRLGRI